MQLSLQQVKLLEVSMNGKYQKPVEIKQNEALEYSRHKTVTELRRFLGLAGWFRLFIKDYAEITKKLHEMTKGNKKKVS